MSTREKILATLLIILFVCLVVWVVRTTPNSPPPQEKIEPPTVMEYEGNTIIEEHDGQIVWELTCDKMRVDTLTQNIELDGVKGKFYQRDKKVDETGAEKVEEKIWELNAAQGIYFQLQKNIHVEGDVKVINSDGAELVSEKIDWFGEQEMLVAEGNVIVTNSDGAKLWSNTVNWFTAQEKIVATGNVKLAKDDMRAFGDMAYSDNGFKHFGLWGHAKILKGVKDDET